MNNLLWIRNCSTYSDSITSHALGVLAGSRRTLLHMQQRPAGGRHGLILKVGRIVKNLTLSIDAYLLEEQFCRSDLDRQSLKLFGEHVSSKKNDKMSSDMGSVPAPKNTYTVTTEY